jgi:hypothetical protein
MTEYENLKKSYIATIHLGLTMNANYDEVRHGNDVLHKFCETLVEHSLYSEDDKRRMKNDLELTKELLSQEIDTLFHK